MIAGIPVIASVLAFAIMMTYPLAGGKLEAVRKKLAETHRGKE
jgi:Na+/melibiose symporter-like transporter